MFDNLSCLLVGHPFTGRKKMLWMAIIQAFFWLLWESWNNRLFRNDSTRFDLFRDLVICFVLV